MRWHSPRSLLLRGLFPSLILAGTSAAAATWHVHPDGSGDAPTIQAAIDLAASGDVILLASGTFSGPGNRDISYRDKTLVVRSEAGAASTIIDCEGLARGFTFHSEAGHAELRGVTIINGRAEQGGGMSIRNSFLGGFPTTWVRECVITQCEATTGGGIYCGDFSEVTIENNTIIENRADEGGGLSIPGYASATIRFNTVSRNTASVSGGGIYEHAGISPSPHEIEDNLIEGNNAPIGGGLSLNDWICRRNRFIQNVSAMGAGVFVSGAPPEFGGNLIAGNEGIGLYVDLSTRWTIANCTVVGNQSHGVYANRSKVLLHGCIIAFNGETALFVEGHAPNSPSIECVDVFGNGSNSTAGVASSVDLFFQDPEFCATSGANAFYLRDTSPCAPASSPCAQLVGAFPVNCTTPPPPPPQFVGCPPDTVVALEPTGTTLTLPPFSISNSGLAPSPFFYRVTSVGAAMLSNGGNPLSLIGVTPVLGPGESFSPPSAVLNAPSGLTSFEQDVSCYVVELAHSAEDSCGFKVNFEQTVSIAIQNFDARLEGRNVQLRWAIQHDGEADEIVVRRQLVGEGLHAPVVIAQLPVTAAGFIDTAARAGRTYDFDITVSSNGNPIAVSPSIRVSVPALVLGFQSAAPNPFRTSTWVAFDVPEQGPVSLEVFDVRGRRVRTLVNKEFSQGSHRVEWHPSGDEARASGIYFLRLSQGKQSARMKVVVLK